MMQSTLRELLEAARQACHALTVETTGIDRTRASLRLESALAAVQTDADSKKHSSPEFDGDVYDPALDKNRLRKQLGRVYELMRDGAWRTLDDVSLVTKDPHASISAQLRHLRKPRFGGYMVEKRPRGRRIDGFFEYRLLAADGRIIGQQ